MALREVTGVQKSVFEYDAGEQADGDVGGGVHAPLIETQAVLMKYPN